MTSLFKSASILPTLNATVPPAPEPARLRRAGDDLLTPRLVHHDRGERSRRLRSRGRQLAVVLGNARQRLPRARPLGLRPRPRPGRGGRDVRHLGVAAFPRIGGGVASAPPLATDAARLGPIRSPRQLAVNAIDLTKTYGS